MRSNDARLDAHVARVESSEPDCRDCEVGEPHVCPLLADGLDSDRRRYLDRAARIARSTS